MITVNRLKQAIAESQQLSPNPPIPRDYYLSWLNNALDNRLIKAVVGFRRSGKSYLLKMLSRTLMEKGVPMENIFFLNFEHDLLTSVKTVRELRAVWEMYLREIANVGQPIYIIWDEIQLVNNWEKLVRTLYEQDTYTILLSGSNSQLLSGELASSLSGRSLQLEILPFSFSEYLRFRRLDHLSYYQHKARIDREFITYLTRGGIAEQFGLDDALAANYQTGLIQKIILDDIVKRYQIDKVNVLKEAFEFVRGNLTSTLSLRKIIARLDNQGLVISPTTLDNYLFYWQTAYAISRVTKFDYRLSRVFDRTAKYYVADNLLIPGRDEATEKRLENLVYNELVRRYGRENIHFAQDANGYEIDFLVKKQDRFLFFQVCLQLNDRNARREIDNLKLVNKYLKGDGIILVLEDIRTTPDKTPVQPVIEWLVSDAILTP